LPELVSDLVRRQVAVLVATGGEPASLAAKAATSSIPIVFAIGGDPVKGGFVDNLARPGGNMTGLTQFTEPLEGKRLALLHELTSKAEIGALLNPNFPPFDLQLKALNDAAERLSVRLIPAFAREEREFEPAFKELLNKGAGAMLAASDPFFNSHREKLVALAASHKLPAIYEFREYVAAGGLMSYGASLADGYRLVGIYTGQILKGSRPADLPVLQPTKFELVINLKTARTSRIEMPLSLLRSADEVIE
jgi:putative ABC transport system substrate-binding protein